jgi:dienelactone hydrolase
MTSVHTETLTYPAGGKTLRSFLAFDESLVGKRPGIVLFGEWWGLNEYLKRRARQIAELGYVALAADVYGDAKTAADAKEAGALMNGLFADMPATNERIKGAIAALAARPEVDATRLGAMGYCLGGALSLHAARLGLDLKGVASFHGSLDKTHAAKKGDVKAKVLVCHGADDKFVSPEQLESFKQEMRELGADLKFVSYPGALHGFTNPEATENGRRNSLPLAYDENADRKSWEEMKSFWARVFA